METKPAKTPKKTKTRINPSEPANITPYTNIENDLFKDSILPETLQIYQTPEQNRHSTYNKQVITEILLNIASDGSKTVEGHCVAAGIAIKTVHVWMLYSEVIKQCYYRAMEIRQEAKIRDIERLEVDLDAYIENEDNDVREKNIRIQRYRTRTLTRQWEAARLNKRYQEKTQSDTVITIDHADLRAQAWDQVHSQPNKEIPYISADKPADNNDTQVSRNTPKE